MNNLLEIWEEPTAQDLYMIVGWQQWADAGAISSGLPQYLINHTQARKIGQIQPKPFYLFQFPGTHHLLRPEIKLEEGYRKSLSTPKNEFFYTGNEDKGLVIFLGEEPHLNVEQYADTFFDAAEMLGIQRIAVVGGVYGAMPYDKDRNASCAYSLPEMKAELSEYAVRFSNYEGGATIGSYMLDAAEKRGLEFLVLYAFVPAYDFSQLSGLGQGIRIDNDYKAWYDLMLRLNHMFDLPLDLSDLERQSDELLTSMHTKIDRLQAEIPQLNIRDYLAQVTEEFTERSFMPLGDVWERELGDILDDIED